MLKKVAKKPATKATKPAKKLTKKASAVEELTKKAAKENLPKTAKSVVVEKPVEKVVPPAKKVRIPIPEGLTGEAAKLALKWRQLFEKTQSTEAVPYKMSGHYEAKTPIKHKILGWGYILTSNNSRIEVLFQNGIKTLITDLKE